MFFERGCSGPRRNKGSTVDETQLESLEMLSGAVGVRKASLEHRPVVVGLAVGYRV